MGIQFFREEVYAIKRSLGAPRKGGKRVAGKASARDVVLENIRAAGAAPHVPIPRPPICHAGLPPEQLEAWCDNLEIRAKQAKVHVTRRGIVRQRSDTPILLAAVASFPGPADENDQRYVEWRRLTIKFALENYDDVVSILEHTDETNGHLHILRANDGRSVKHLHAGHAAAVQAKKQGATRKEQSLAYKAACRTLQDRYFEKVSIACGLARLGPRRPRKSKGEWQAEQQSNAARAAAMMALKMREAEVENARKLAIETVKRIKAKNDQVEAAAAKAKAERESLAVERAALEAQRLKYEEFQAAFDSLPPAAKLHFALHLQMPRQKL